MAEPLMRVEQGSWALEATASPDVPHEAVLTLYRDGQVHSSRRCDTYKVWTYGAHLDDIIADIEMHELAGSLMDRTIEDG